MITPPKKTILLENFGVNLWALCQTDAAYGLGRGLFDALNLHHMPRNGDAVAAGLLVDGVYE